MAMQSKRVAVGAMEPTAFDSIPGSMVLLVSFSRAFFEHLSQELFHRISTLRKTLYEIDTVLASALVTDVQVAGEAAEFLVRMSGGDHLDVLDVDTGSL